MCTILYLHGVHPELPLIVAANRDEQYSRPATPPAIVGRSPAILCGSDLRAGGTWMGVNAHGLFVGLTNQRTFRTPDVTARSRGDVVRLALASTDVRGVIAQLHTLDARRYNAFNLLFGDGQQLMVAYARPEQAAIEIEAAPRGVAVLPNDRIGAAGFPKAERATAAARALLSVPTPPSWSQLADGLSAILADHELAALDALPTPPPDSPFDREALRRHSAICTHTDAYGTCSAAIVALAPGRVQRYLYADGPPCRAPFVDYASLLPSR